MKTKDTLLCCGVDPDIRHIPTKFFSSSVQSGILKYITGLVDDTYDIVCAYKIQKAFFDQWAFGRELLYGTVATIRSRDKELPIFLDCKIGDIGNTMEVYLSTLFGFGVDGIVVNPYMGDETLMPFVNMPNLCALPLVRTSNPGAMTTQDVRLGDGRMYWEYMLDLVMKHNTSKNMVPILSSTTGYDYPKVRDIIGDATVVLLAGVGAQGGSIDALKGLKNQGGRGVFVNSSRAIMYPSDGDIRKSALQLRRRLNE